MLLWHGKSHVNGAELVDDHQRVVIVISFNEITLVNQKVSCTPVYGGAEETVGKLEFGVIHGRLIGVDGRFEGGSVGADLVVLLLGRVSLLEQFRVATLLLAGVFHLD